MEDREVRPTEATVKVDEAPNIYQIPPTAVNPNSSSAPAVGIAGVAVPIVFPNPEPGTETAGKKKRGRPRKYAPDGSLNNAISPMPISASIPLSGDYSNWKRGKATSDFPIKKSQTIQFAPPVANLATLHGEGIAYFVGANFTPHAITVNPGEDITMKIMTFPTQGSHAICILSANGTVSNVTLRQPTTYGGTLTYEGLFELLSLSGSFMPTEVGGQKSRSGGMSVSLAGPDGRVVGGSLAGLLIASGPVQVVLGTFLPGSQQEQKYKKDKMVHAPTVPTVTSPTVGHIHREELKTTYGEVRTANTQPSFFHGGNNAASLNPVQGFTISTADNHASSPEEDSKGTSQSNYEVSS